MILQAAACMFSELRAVAAADVSTAGAPEFFTCRES